MTESTFPNRGARKEFRCGSQGLRAIHQKHWLYNSRFKARGVLHWLFTPCLAVLYGASAFMHGSVRLKVTSLARCFLSSTSWVHLGWVGSEREDPPLKTCPPTRAVG
eukprot:6365977-Amphidinium_carterae.1